MVFSLKGQAHVFALSLLAFLSFSCKPDPPIIEPPSLEDFLPAPPEATGDPQAVFTGVLTPDNLAEERVDGPAAQGLPGDIFLRNDKIRLIIQQPDRSIALLPTGGNIIDADIIRDKSDPLFDVDNNPTNGVGNDQWGELSILLQLGRVIDVDRVEIVSDGSGGGAALIRFFGKDDIDDFINLPGVFPIPLGDDLDPDRELGYEAAIDYLLEPGADFVQVRYTVFNGSQEEVSTPVGILGDIGGISEPFITGQDFGGAGFEDLINDNVSAAPYAAIQTPGIGYGVIPFYLDPQTQEPHPEMLGITLVISGGLAIAFDTVNLGELITPNFNQRGLRVEAESASTTGFDFVVGAQDIGVVETRFQELRKEITPTPLTGSVLAGTEPIQDARVGVFLSDDDILDDNEVPITVFATDAEGKFSGALAPGSYLLVADAEGVKRAAPQRVNLNASPEIADFILPEPAKVTYNIQDVTDALNPFFVPAKITVVGVDANPRDDRFRDVKASSHIAVSEGIVSTRHSQTGSSTTDKEGAILLEDGEYRVVVSRGMEYDIHEELIVVAPGETVEITAQLSHVVDTIGYIKSDFHQHAVNSPDAPVDLALRALTYATEGTEFFASTDHDFRTDYEPVLEALFIDNFVDSIPGEETTTFDYGHFNAFPLEVDKTLPNNGALDWGRGRDFFNLLPSEIFSALRDEGARVVQINHPRSLGLGFQQYFDQSKLTFDFDNRVIESDLESLTNDVFRLEENVALFDDNFDAIELYNGFNVDDLNGDGVPEEVVVDIGLQDFFNFFSLGKIVTMVGTSDTHSVIDPVGAPGTYVRVSDDSEDAITFGSIREDILSAISGSDFTGAPVARDAVVSNTPFVRVEIDNQSIIGSLVAADKNTITFNIHIESPDWAAFDTVELFANQIFLGVEAGAPPTPGVIIPDLCFTARQDRLANDTCDTAIDGAQELTVVEEIRNPATGASVFVADLTVTVDLDTLANRGDTGDTWIVVRVYGVDSVFPIIPDEIDEESIPDIVQLGTAAARGGVFPLAITNPILVDANGDGQFTAPFAP